MNNRANKLYKYLSDAKLRVHSVGRERELAQLRDNVARTNIAVYSEAFSQSPTLTNAWPHSAAFLCALQNV